MAKMPNVWIVNQGEHDYTLAEKYGPLKAITTGRINIFQIDNLKAKLEKSLSDATSEDYLLLSGTILPNALALNYLLRINGMVKCLVWVGNKDCYRVITVRQ